MCTSDQPPTSPFASLHVRGYLLSRTEKLNVFADQLATDVLTDLRALNKPTTEFYSLLACRVYLCDGTRYGASHEQRTLTNDFPVFELVRTSNSASIGPTTSLMLSAGLPIDRPFLYSLIMSDLCEQTQPWLLTKSVFGRLAVQPTQGRNSPVPLPLTSNLARLGHHSA
jgi:hypothetical protein